MAGIDSACRPSAGPALARPRPRGPGAEALILDAVNQGAPTAAWAWPRGRSPLWPRPLQQRSTVDVPGVRGTPLVAPSQPMDSARAERCAGMTNPRSASAQALGTTMIPAKGAGDGEVMQSHPWPLYYYP